MSEVRTNFDKFSKNLNLAEDVGLYGVETVNVGGDLQMGPRILLGTSKEPLQNIFPALYDDSCNFLGPNVDCVDMVYSGNYSALQNDTFAKYIDQEDSKPYSKPTIPGWNLVSYEKSKSFEYINAPYDDEESIVEEWLRRCDNKHRDNKPSYAWKYEDIGGYTVNRYSIIRELARKLGGCIKPDAYYWKSENDTTITYTLPGFDDPYFLPDIGEVYAFSMPIDESARTPSSIQIFLANSVFRSKIVKKR